MLCRTSTIPLLALIAITACGGNSGSGGAGGGSGPGGGGGGGGAAVSPGRLAWDQNVESADVLSRLSFRLWVGDSSENMDGVSCTPVNDRLGACSAQVRPLAPGRYTLRVSAVGPDGATSPVSEPIEVTVGSSLTVTGEVPELSSRRREPLAADSARPGEAATLARVEVIAADERLVDTTDLSVSPDGRVFVARRDGEVHLASSEEANANARVLTGASSSAAAGEASALLTLALDPDFTRNQLLYMGTSDTAGFHLTRYRLDGDQLFEALPVLDVEPAVAEQPFRDAVARFGPDGALYIALDDQGDSGRAGDMGVFSGKVLRLNRDGSVPADQAGLTPVYATDIASPRGLAWPPASAAGTASTLWVADARTPDAATLTVVSDDGAAARRGRRGQMAARYALPDGDRPAALIAHDGSLLVALQESGEVWRVALDQPSRQTATATDRWLDASHGPVRALAAAPGGRVIVAVDGPPLVLAPVDPAR